MSDTQSEIMHAEEQMSKAVDHLENELTKIRAGRANPAMLDGVRVDYYGSEMPLNQVSNINTPDARTILVQPWEKKMIDPIEKAIIAANLGFNPNNNGEAVIISVPMLTEERRKELVKAAHKEAENARVSLRSARHKAIDGIKRLQKDGLAEDLAKDAEAEVEKLMGIYTKRIDVHLEAKEKDIMKV
ncbi:MAG: ribosome recycling factor [Flavobacteriales bacterium]|nr:ribosome recycling factor [Flavobacteriales bacterium]MCB9166754.1 ribosome recycling factor [Flavobacteriales bacterium]